MLEHFQDLQLRPQSQRLQILELLHELMSHHRSALKDMGAESLVGITDLVSGEKDPRNLMIIFSVLKVVMVEWDVVGHAEVIDIVTQAPSFLLTSTRRFSTLSSATSRLPFDRRQMIPTESLHKTLRIVYENASPPQNTLLLTLSLNCSTSLIPHLPT